MAAKNARPATRVPTVHDVDARLMAPTPPRAGDLWRVADEHTVLKNGDGRYPVCGWQTDPVRRDCPSRTIARALMRGAAVPEWLALLEGEVPRVRASRRRPTTAERAVVDDELPGLFDAPTRQNGI